MLTRSESDPSRMRQGGDLIVYKLRGMPAGRRWKSLCTYIIELLGAEIESGPLPFPSANGR